MKVNAVTEMPNRTANLKTPNWLIDNPLERLNSIKWKLAAVLESKEPYSIFVGILFNQRTNTAFILRPSGTFKNWLKGFNSQTHSTRNRQSAHASTKTDDSTLSPELGQKQ
jgi:hypothetical protein